MNNNANSKKELADTLLSEIDQRFPNLADNIATTLGQTIFYRYPGLRLTSTGYGCLQSLYKGYEFDNQVYGVTRIDNRSLILLHQKMTTPYYMGSGKLVLFDGVCAMNLEMMGNIQDWIRDSL